MEPVFITSKSLNKGRPKKEDPHLDHDMLLICGNSEEERDERVACARLRWHLLDAAALCIAIGTGDESDRAHVRPQSKEQPIVKDCLRGSRGDAPSTPHDVIYVVNIRPMTHQCKMEASHEPQLSKHPSTESWTIIKLSAGSKKKVQTVR
jgi:hypothetical protein